MRSGEKQGALAFGERKRETTEKEARAVEQESRGAERETKNQTQGTREERAIENGKDCVIERERVQTRITEVACASCSPAGTR